MAPRNVCNWWLVADIDGRRGALESGPRAKDGGIYVAISQRDDGEISNALTVIGTAREDGTLYLEVLDRNGKIVYSHDTQR